VLIGCLVAVIGALAIGLIVYALSKRARKPG
jgi:hypothetical protein